MELHGERHIASGQIKRHGVNVPVTGEYRGRLIAPNVCHPWIVFPRFRRVRKLEDVVFRLGVPVENAVRG